MPFSRMSERRAHLAADNPLRSLTEVIRKVPGGINLGQGVCDMDMPTPLKVGLDVCVGGGDRQTYTHYSGLPELKEAIAAKLARDNGLSVDVNQILVTAGSSAAFFAAGTTLLEPGDEVILFEPFYSYHYSQLKLLGAIPVAVPLDDDGFSLDLDLLQSALTPRTRMVVVNTPGNPTGKVFTADELRGIAQVLEGTDAVVVTDEVYEYMCFDGRKHVSPASLPELADRTLTLSSFSKTYSITGWRIGFLCGPAHIVEACGRVFDQLDVCAARPMQRGVQRALEDLPSSFYSELQAKYELRRDRMCEALEIAGYKFNRPEGAYYVLADYRGPFGNVSPADAVYAMIDRIGVNAVPGDLFHRPGSEVRSMRFHFAVEDAVLDDVCDRLKSLAR